MRHNLSNIVRELLRTFARSFDSYRPELYYMRGPGPKWHAKRVGSAMSAASATVETVRALRKVSA